jgi:hypothetical protein
MHFFNVAIGGLIGALFTGGAQLLSFYLGRRSARSDLSLTAAGQLLGVIYSSFATLLVLPHTDSPAGSPLSYGERHRTAQPMLDELNRARFTILPLVKDGELARRFGRYAELCEHISSTYVDAEAIHRATDQVKQYGRSLGDALSAHINRRPLPPEAEVTIAIGRAGERLKIAGLSD